LSGPVGILDAYALFICLALGSAFATGLLSEQIALAEGLVATMLLVGLQLAAWLQVRSGAVERLLTAEPTLLFYQGRWLSDTMRRAGDPRRGHSAVRQRGLSGLEQAEVVVLEATGELPVIRRGTGAGALVSPLPPGVTLPDGSGCDRLPGPAERGQYHPAEAQQHDEDAGHRIQDGDGA
jgi:uncharacterized membrane protein YcaP (DUF421 family)